MQAVHKRAVAIAIGQGNISEAVTRLNAYLKMYECMYFHIKMGLYTILISDTIGRFMRDTEAWTQLAELYLQLNEYVFIR